MHGKEHLAIAPFRDYDQDKGDHDKVLEHEQILFYKQHKHSSVSVSVLEDVP
jgi:hypothetical protein